MAFVVFLWDIALLAGAISIITLIVSEVASPYYGRISTLIEFKKLRTFGIASGIITILIAAIQNYT